MLSFVVAMISLLLQKGGSLIVHGTSHNIGGITSHHHHHQHRGLFQATASTATKNIVQRAHEALRCGTIDMNEKEIQEVEAKLGQYLKTVTDTSRIFQSTVTIDVSFHVIYNGATGAGVVPDSMVTDQIQVLNVAFASHGFQFNLREVVRTDNGQWYTNCFVNQDYKEVLRDPNDGLDVLYFYTCIPIRDDEPLFGFGTLPWAFPDRLYLDGVVVNDATLPGGGEPTHNEGDNAVHEIGHWLGLLHTFQGGCSGDGDFIADTPAEREPAFFCPVGRNTCLFDPGLDPIDNYMDYSDDSCLTKFTPGQRDRMQAMWNIFRSSTPKSPTIVLTNGVALSGQSLGAGESQVYELQNIQIESLALFDITGDNGNIDLYIVNENCLSSNADSIESCAVVVTQDGASVLATAYAVTDAMDFIVTATATAPTQPIALQPGQTLTGQSGQPFISQRYFILDVAAGTSLTVSISGPTGDANLYVGIGFDPTTEMFDCAAEGSTSFGVCQITGVSEASTVNVLIVSSSGYTNLNIAVFQGFTNVVFPTSTPVSEDTPTRIPGAGATTFTPISAPPFPDTQTILPITEAPSFIPASAAQKKMLDVACLAVAYCSVLCFSTALSFF